MNFLKLNFLLTIIFGTSLILQTQSNQNNEIILVNTDDQASVGDETNSANEKEAYNLNDPFVPTNEWQKVKPGQVLPKGLHVRLNLESGEKEAKLMDDTANRPSLNKQLEEAIKNLNDEDFPNSDETPEEKMKRDELRKKFRSYDKLKEEMENLNLNIKTDYEILKELTNKLNQSGSQLERAEKLNILKDLEFYVHQYDNGLLLCDMGGFETILNDLNKTDSKRDLEVNIHSLLVLGSAVQSNPKVQVFAIKTDLLQYILNKLSLSIKTSSTSSNNILDNEFYSKLLFTLSGMIRNFPFAQSQFIRFGGVEILSQVLQHSSSIKIKTKILTFIDDLIKEKDELMSFKENYSAEDYQTKMSQYEKINLVDELLDKKWCENYEKVLSQASDPDTREKIINSMLTLLNKCNKNFHLSASLKDSLKSIRDEFVNMDKIEKTDDDLYFSDLITSIDSILSGINSKDEF